MRIAFIIQRYGIEVVGGAELHCRWIVERCAQHHDVEVITTTAIEYLTWENDYHEGIDTVNGVRVRRFRVDRIRNEERFQEISNKVCFFRHTDAEENLWIQEHGPCSSQLLDYLKTHHNEFDVLVFFCYRYWTSFFGLQIAPEKSILVPTAEHDRAIHLRLFKQFFSLPAAIMYNSPEEKKLIGEISITTPAPGPVVGVGITAQPNIDSELIRTRMDMLGSYIVYVGRIEREKGCLTLIDYFLRFINSGFPHLNLVLVGKSSLRIEEHVNILSTGVLAEQDKYATIGASRLLVMPSPYESLSMVLLEAWLMNRPVLVNGDCDVLRGQCQRSNGGLWYRTYEEFAETLSLLLTDETLNTRMGSLGNRYFSMNYNWDTILRKYENTFLQIKNRKTGSL